MSTFTTGDALIEALTDELLEDYAEWRGYSNEFAFWLRSQRKVGYIDGHYCYPVFGIGGEIIGAQVFVRKEHRSFYIGAVSGNLTPVVLGIPHTAKFIFTSESAHDSFGVADRSGLWKDRDYAWVASRGSGCFEKFQDVPWRPSANGEKHPLARVIRLRQRDDKKGPDGLTANERWATKTASIIGLPYTDLLPPDGFKDWNDATRDGFPVDDLLILIAKQREVEPTIPEPGEEEVEETRKTRLREKYKELKSKSLSEASRVLPEILLESMIFLTRRMLISGASKSRKTWLCLQLAFCVSKGIPLFGRFKTKKVGVTFANLELMEASVKLRLEAMAQALSYKDDINENFRLISAADYQDKIGDDFSEFLAVQAADDRSSLMCIDPMWRLLGMREENSNTDVGHVLKPFARFSREAKASVTGVHHFAKGVAALKEAIDRLSGAGAWARDAATLFVLSRHREPDAYTVDIVTNDFPPVDAFCVRFVYPIFVPAPDLDPKDLKPAPSAKKESTKGDQHKQTVIALLYATDNNGGLTQAEMRKATGVPGIQKSSLKRALESLIKEKKVYQSPVEKPPKYALTALFREEMDEEAENEEENGE